MNRAAAALLAAACLGVSTASQAMQLEVSRPQLCSISDVVVVGKVVGMDTHWAVGPDGGIERHAFLAVDETLHGEALEGAVVVLPGGERDGQKHWVEDVPDLEIGERYALFLRQMDAGWIILGGEQGSVRIATEQDWVGETAAYVAQTLEDCHG